MIKSPLCIGFRVTFIFLIGSCINICAEKDGTLTGRITNIPNGQDVWVGIQDPLNEDVTWHYTQSGSFKFHTPMNIGARILTVIGNNQPFVKEIPNTKVLGPINIKVPTGFDLTVSVTSDEGLAVRGAEILLLPIYIKQEEIKPEIWPIWRTSSKGIARIKNIYDGNYRIKVNALGYVPLILDDIVIREQFVDSIRLNLMRAHFINGKTIDSNGDALEDLKVNASWEIYRDIGVITEGVIKNDFSKDLIPKKDSIQTSAEGLFHFGPFYFGEEVKIYVSSSSIGSSKPYKIVAPENELVIDLKNNLVRGLVKDLVTGMPITDFRIIGHSRAHRSYDVKNPYGQRFPAPNRS